MAGDDDTRRGRRLSQHEREIWERLTHSVLPLKRMPARPVHEPENGAAAPSRVANKLLHKRGHAPARPPVLDQAPKSSPPLAPIDRRVRQRLARGTEAIDARIDLHGMTQSRAHAALARFLREAQAGGARFVLVITGKGGGAYGKQGERGVLKRQVPLWLTLPEFRALVLGFEPAHVSHGGEGALYVRLRRARS
jgi:DNA-nicking Smr family endonuclease